MFPFNQYYNTGAPSSQYDLDSLFNLLHQQQYYQQPRVNSKPRIIKKLETEDEFQIQIQKPYGNYNNYEVKVVKSSTPPLVNIIIQSEQDNFKQTFQFNINYIDIENINWQWYRQRNILCLNIPKRIHYVHLNLEDILNCLFNGHDRLPVQQGEASHDRYHADESDFEEEDAYVEDEGVHSPEVNGSQLASEVNEQAEEAHRRAELEAVTEAEEDRKEAEQARREAELEAKRQVEEAKRQAEEVEEAKRQAELEARRQAALEARRQAELEAKRRFEAEAKKQAELAAKKKAELEAQRQAELEAKKKAEIEAKKRQERFVQLERERQQEYDDFIKQQQDFLKHFFGFNLGPVYPRRDSRPNEEIKQQQKNLKKDEDTIKVTPMKQNPKPKVAPKPEQLKRNKTLDNIKSVPVVTKETSDADSIVSRGDTTLSRTAKEDASLAKLHMHPSLEEVEDEEFVMFKKKFGQ